ncbi:MULTISPECIES: hypothetical protein [Streptomyces]|uniref:hypothetical protein n=1 Tax=Streptomyces TaxID=1883 RepID=UPI0011F0EE14|nr:MULTISPECIES: hypothetical protein [Streptomyces]
MSFQDEWASIKSEAGQRGSVHTQIDHVLPPDGAGPGSGKDGMSSSSAGKKKAAGYIEKHLGPDVKEAGSLADATTETVTGEAPPGQKPSQPPFFAPRPTMPAPGTLGSLKGWGTQEALSYAMTKWTGAIDKLVGHLQHEMESLRDANNLIHGNDHATGSTFAPSSGPLSSRISDY